MNKLLLCLLLATTSVVASSQKVYFIYLQSESEQAFFVKMNEKIYSSTASGYLILSKLVDSTYTLNLGFPQNKWAEQTFTVTVNKNDHGYLVKNFGEKGWGLFDLQTLAVQMSSAGSAKMQNPSPSENKDVSAFTDILSKAADDPSLRDKPVQPKVEEKKPDAVVQETVKKDLTAVAGETKKDEIKAEPKELPSTKPVEIVQQPVVKNEEPKVVIKELPVTKPVEIVPQPVVKNEEPKAEIKESPEVKPAETTGHPPVKKEEAKSEIKEPVVTTHAEHTPLVAKNEEIKGDTKELPLVKADEVVAAVNEEYKKSSVTKRSESSTTEGFGLVFTDDDGHGLKDTIRILIPNPKPVAAIIKEEPKEDKKFLDMSVDISAKEEEKKTEVKSEVPGALNNKSLSKTNCAEVAAESDFFKLRKTMAAAEDVDDMIGEARKYFKSKCFTVAQIKNLSTLFLNDESKYKFFDAAYNYTNDAVNFSSLQTELRDEYYINRFKAMLRN